MMYELTVRNGKRAAGTTLVYGKAYAMVSMIEEISEHYVSKDKTELSFEIKPYIEGMTEDEFAELEELKGAEDGTEHETI